MSYVTYENLRPYVHIAILHTSIIFVALCAPPVHNFYYITNTKIEAIGFNIQ